VIAEILQNKIRFAIHSRKNNPLAMLVGYKLKSTALICEGEHQIKHCINVISASL